jgi:hypothetical protein
MGNPNLKSEFEKENYVYEHLGPEPAYIKI